MKKDPIDPYMTRLRIRKAYATQDLLQLNEDIGYVLGDRVRAMFLELWHLDKRPDIRPGSTLFLDFSMWQEEER